MDDPSDASSRTKAYKVYRIFGNTDFDKLVTGIRLADCMKSESSYIVDQQPLAQDPLLAEKELQVPSVPDVMSCSHCRVSFETRTEHRQHYKLDWHRHNLKLGLKGLKGITEEEFDRLNDDDVSSISGSETSSSPSEREVEDIELTKRVRHAKVFFVNAENQMISLYRCILHGKEDAPKSNEALFKLAQECPVKCKWAVILLGGGHFAAGVFNGNKAVLHKTFHSYTVRSKQGGSQSARDGKSGTNHPRSAGASLRRYNEQTLKQHISDILAAWKDELSMCDSIFLRAVSHNRNLIFSGKNSILQKDDPRIISIPFPTRRATFKEVNRVHEILSSVELYGNAEEFVDSFPATPKAFSKKSEETPARIEEPKRRIERDKSRDVPVRPLPDLVEQLALSSSSDDVEEDGQLDNLVELQQICDCVDDLLEFDDDVPEKERHRPKRGSKRKKNKSDKKQEKDAIAVAEALSEHGTILKTLLFTSRHSTKAMENILEGRSQLADNELLLILHSPIDTRGNNLLHEAANQGLLDRIRLLLEYGLDPSVPNKEGKVPYKLAKDNQARKVFRRFQAEFPYKFDYGKAQVPGPLTDEIEQMENEMQAAIKKAKKQAKKEKVNEKKKAEQSKRKEEEALKKELEAQERFMKLSDREKCALAAERRLLAAGGQVTIRCFKCGCDISGSVPFSYQMFQFCSMDCLRKHRLHA